MSDETKESKDNNKVVPFPSHKIKRPKSVQTQTNGQSTTSVRKTTFFISLVATVIMATMLTSRMNNPQSADPGRFIASQTRELQEDILLARKIAKASLREPASRGRAPTAEDMLRDGELAGLYLLSYGDAGGLTGLEYRGAPGSERLILDRGDFIKRNLDLFRIDATSHQLSASIQDKERMSASIQDKDRIYEVYDMKRDNQVRARIHFTVDDKGHLYSMKVESNPL